MEFDEIITERFSVRKYKDIQPDDETIDKIIDAGMKAPTGKNHQPQRIYVIKSKEALGKLNSVCKCVFGAPLAMLVCWNGDECWHSRFEEGYTCGETDADIVAAYMMLKAWDLGVGSCWVRYFDSSEVSAAFGLPENIKPACILDLGYAADDCVPLSTMHANPRPVSEIVTVL